MPEEKESDKPNPPAEETEEKKEQTDVPPAVSDKVQAVQKQSETVLQKREKKAKKILDDLFPDSFGERGRASLINKIALHYDNVEQLSSAYAICIGGKADKFIKKIKPRLSEIK